jgi:signal transduction histidine kinase
MSLPKPLVTVSAVALTVLIGVLDFAAGHHIGLSAFYLVPISWACWVAGRRTGLLLATTGAVIWLIAELMTGFHYPHALIPYWNALMLLILFLVVVYLLSAFQSAHYHLEETVQQRTAALQAEIAERKRMERAKLQAERLAAVGTMAAEVAHEVRNPLGSITLNLDLIHKEIDKLAETSRHPPQESDVLVNEMRQEVQRIQHVIEDYLQFARLPKAQRRPVALNELLDQKLAFMHSVIQEANVTLCTEFDPTLPTVNADGEQLWQAVLNLIRNSLEAMPDGGMLTVGTGREDGQVVLRVTDTGKGMAEQQVRQLFVPFFTTKSEGSGLGLALVQQIVSEHGGHIECTSAIGKGSTFTIFLPLTEHC